MHVYNAIALSRKAIAQTKERFGSFPNQFSEGFNIGDGNARDRLSPRRCFVQQVCFQLVRTIGVFF